MMRFCFMLLLIGCGSSSDSNKAVNTITPDGKPGVIAHCSSLMGDQALCYEQMGKACEKGYTILKDETGWKLAECK